MYLSQNKDKGGLESLPETGQWNRGDKTRIESVEGINNEDPGVNSDDEEDVPQVMLNVRELQCSTFLLLQMETFSSQGSNQSLGANKLELVSTNRRSLREKHQRLEVEPNQKAITATHTKSERSTEGPPAQKAIPRSVSYSSSRREWDTTLGNKGNNCQAQSAPQLNWV